MWCQTNSHPAICEATDKQGQKSECKSHHDARRERLDGKAERERLDSVQATGATGAAPIPAQRPKSDTELMIACILQLPQIQGVETNGLGLLMHTNKTKFSHTPAQAKEAALRECLTTFQKRNQSEPLIQLRNLKTQDVRKLNYDDLQRLGRFTQVSGGLTSATQGGPADRGAIEGGGVRALVGSGSRLGGLGLINRADWASSSGQCDGTLSSTWFFYMALDAPRAFGYEFVLMNGLEVVGALDDLPAGYPEPCLCPPAFDAQAARETWADTYGDCVRRANEGDDEFWLRCLAAGRAWIADHASSSSSSSSATSASSASSSAAPLRSRASPMPDDFSFRGAVICSTGQSLSVAQSEAIVALKGTHRGKLSPLMSLLVTADVDGPGVKNAAARRHGTLFASFRQFARALQHASAGAFLDALMADKRHRRQRDSAAELPLAQSPSSSSMASASASTASAPASARRSAASSSSSSSSALSTLHVSQSESSSSAASHGPSSAVAADYMQTGDEGASGDDEFDNSRAFGCVLSFARNFLRLLGACMESNRFLVSIDFQIRRWRWPPNQAPFVNVVVVLV
jgi:hypothetical protein